MAHMDGTGPDGKGPKTGRGLGKIADTKDPKILDKLGVGQGKRRKSGGGTGNSKRIQSGNQ